MTESSKGDDVPRYKVGKVIDRYSLDGLGDELEARWIGRQGEASSLRDLAEYFNTEVFRSALANTDHHQFGTEIDSLYHLLTDDDVSRGEQTRVRKTLERDGIDVEQLLRDFVTHQAIHTYLTKGRGVEKPTETGDRLDSARQTINRLRSRLVAVTDTTLTNLRETDVITLGAFDVFVEISVHCNDCGTHKNLLQLLTDRGCDCSHSQ